MLVVLKLHGYDTRQQEGLQIKVYMDIIQAATCDVKVIKPKDWAEGLAFAGLTNILFMPHFGHSIQAITYVK